MKTIRPALKQLLLDNARAQTAYANGEDCKFESSWDDGQTWQDSMDPLGLCWHRVKRAPKLRPFTLEEAHRLVGRTVRWKDSPDNLSQILRVKPYGSKAEICVHEHKYTAEGALDCIELYNPETDTWLPCGVEVEND